MKNIILIAACSLLFASVATGSANSRDGTSTDKSHQAQVITPVIEDATAITLKCYSFEMVAEVQVAPITVLDPCRKETFKAVVGPVKEYESPELKRNHGPPVRYLS